MEKDSGGIAVTVVQRGKRLCFKEESTGIFFNFLIAYTMWVNGNFEIRRNNEMIDSGLLLEQGPYNSCGFGGLKKIVDENKHNPKFAEAMKSRFFRKLLPGFFQENDQIILNVGGKRGERTFSYINFLKNQATDVGDGEKMVFFPDLNY